MGCKSRSSLPQSLGFEKDKRNIFIGLLINMVFPVGAVLRACFKKFSQRSKSPFATAFLNGLTVNPLSLPSLRL